MSVIRATLELKVRDSKAGHPSPNKCLTNGEASIPAKIKLNYKEKADILTYNRK